MKADDDLSAQWSNQRRQNRFDGGRELFSTLFSLIAFQLDILSEEGRKAGQGPLEHHIPLHPRGVSLILIRISPAPSPCALPISQISE